MVDDYLVRSLKRVHDQAAETLEVREPTSSKTIAERFNQVLKSYKEEYPENRQLDQIEPIHGTRASHTRRGTVEQAKEDLRAIKLRTEQVADLFELDVADFERVDDGSKIRPIIIEQNTEVSAEATASATVDFTQLIEQVDDAFLSDEDARELKSLIQEFQEEIGSDDTDESHLRDLARRAKEYGTGVGVKIAVELTMAGLQAGYDLIP